MKSSIQRADAAEQRVRLRLLPHVLHDVLRIS